MKLWVATFTPVLMALIVVDGLVSAPTVFLNSYCGGYEK